MSNLTLPFTVKDFLAASHKLNNLPENAPGPRDKLRASGLGGCARRQAATMDANLIVVGDEAEGHVLTPEQGRYVEDLSCDVIDHLPQGLEVVNRQISLPSGYFVTGHPDGELRRKEPGGGTIDTLDDGLWTLDDGLVWGFEHKHLGAYTYNKVFEKGFADADPVYMAQVALYADALGWDAALVVVLSQDESAARQGWERSLEWATNSKKAETRQRHSWALDPGYHPKVNLVALDFRGGGAKHAIEQLKVRAAGIVDVTAKHGAEAVAAEYDPFSTKRNSYPCHWGSGRGACPALDWCRESQQGYLAVAENPYGSIT